MAAYDDWAELYDVVFHGVPGEAEFYVGQAVRIGGRTLEIGCGTGRIAIPMAMSGVDVVGLDDSKAMLDQCQRKLGAIGEVSGQLRLVEADMTDFDLGAQFDFIAMPYRTFMHLLAPEAQRSCLRAVRRHLVDGGTFVLNVWAARPSAIAPFVDGRRSGFQFAGRYELGDGQGMLQHYCISSYEQHDQRLTEQHLFHEIDEAGVLRRTLSLPLERAWLTAREMDHLVRLCGFDVEAVFGDFDCGAFTAESTEMIWVLKKPLAAGG